MAKEICISSTPHETRLAILEDDQLAEIYYERENEYTLAGSIYNGRVTRVLPGMQSAFVDIGLERDAFLYVTDFLELEDQEESDELERAATGSGAKAPREVRSSGRAEERSRREGRERRPFPAAAPEVAEADTDELAEPAAAETSLEEQPGGEPGAKRWRGRRRRRGGRGGGSDAQPGADEEAVTEQSTAASDDVGQPEADHAPASRGRREIHAAADAPAQASGQKPSSGRFVLPGESLSKYGGQPAESQSKSAVEPTASTRSKVTSRPSTMIEGPLQWDGVGLLPGESLSRHRGSPAEVEHDEAAAATAPESLAEAESFSADTPETTVFERLEEEGDLVSAFEAQESPAWTDEDILEEQQLEDGAVTETSAGGLHAVLENPSADDPAHDSARHRGGADISGQPEPDASASHHVDPKSPAGFRLFGMGGKKKKTDGTHNEHADAASGTSTASTGSSFSPGSGLVEEEVIEGEEYDLPRQQHHHRLDEHDLDEYEEETLQTQIRSGELGEMLQEAHLDHRIDLDLEDKNGDEEESLDGDEDDAAAAPRAGEGAPQRREHAGRGRRGRTERGGRRGPSRRTAQTSDLPIISDLLKPGQEILVQIAKEPIAKKGARITSHIALPGRFLVFMPTVTHVGVSRKIASDEERQRLKRILVSERGDASGGFIVRTAADGASEEELRADLRFLIHLWDEIKQRSESSKSPALIYHDLSLIERILRDQVSANFSSIWVDSQDDYERIVRFLNRFSPSLVRRVKLYTKETPLFEHFGVQDEISKALRSKVWLKSGGSIVINQTEALVAIDINTGKYVGKSARLEDTIVKTNLDAVPEIVRQIRLRDLGGIIIIDFIDMDERKNRFKVMAALEEALKNDRAPTKVLQFNDFGLVAITRKRVKQSLERTLSVPCPVCQATGMVKSPATVCNEIYIELRKMRKHFESEDVLLRVNPETVKVLKSNSARWLNEFEELTGRNILVKSDATLHPEQFDIQG
ncbi:MAG TPA: Rne/Rng family ribonuclease [Terracidiphilus sp.]|nr:Rne/Rng family ribonuclease [Terracidiphilus sp.]